MKLSIIFLAAAFVLGNAVFANDQTAAPEKKEHKQHANHEHKHSKTCGHKAHKHGNHTDYDHDGHHHMDHEGHYDECDGAKS